MDWCKEVKKKLINKKFPAQNLMFFFSLLMCCCGSTIVITMPYSFLPKMMKSFGIAEKAVGFYAGMVSSSFYLGQTIGSLFWGYLCDRIGSKRSLLIATMLLAIQTIFFGMSKSFKWAVVTRLMQGVVEGIIVTSKAVVFSVCDASNNSIGLATIVGAYQIGLITGPAIGGFLVYPCKRYPNLCQANSFLVRYPFLLATLIGSSFLLISFLLAYIYIPDEKRFSLAEDTSLLYHQSANKNEEENIDESCSRIAALDKRNGSFLVISMSRASSSAEECHLNNGTTVSYFQIENGIDRKQFHIRSCFSSCYNWIKESSVIKILRIKEVMLSLLLYCISSFNAIGFEEIFPVFADSPLRYGGLGFTTNEIGTTLLISAAPLSILTFSVSKVHEMLGSKMMAIWSYYVIIFGLPLFPYVAAAEQSKIWFVLIPSLLLYNYVTSNNFFAINMHMNVSTPSEFIGVVNGLGVTLSSIFRMASPAMLGSLFSWSLQPGNEHGYPFNHCLPFVVMSFAALVGSMVASCIRQREDYKLNEREIDKNIDNDKIVIKT